MQRDTRGVLSHIQVAADFIMSDTSGMTFDAFMENRLVRQAVERNFEIIGEAVNRLHHHDPDTVKRISAPEKIVSFRNTLIHGYDVIDYPTVWQAIHTSLPVLRAEVEILLNEIQS